MLFVFSLLVNLIISFSYILTFYDIVTLMNTLIIKEYLIFKAVLSNYFLRDYTFYSVTMYIKLSYLRIILLYNCHKGLHFCISTFY